MLFLEIPKKPERYANPGSLENPARARSGILSAVSTKEEPTSDVGLMNEEEAHMNVHARRYKKGGEGAGDNIALKETKSKKSGIISRTIDIEKSRHSMPGKRRKEKPIDNRHKRRI